MVLWWKQVNMCLWCYDFLGMTFSPKCRSKRTKDNQQTLLLTVKAAYNTVLISKLFIQLIDKKFKFSCFFQIRMNFMRINLVLTLRRPLRRKLRTRWFYDISKVKVEFCLNRTSLTPIKSLMRIFWKLPISAFPDFIFQWVLYQDHVLSQMVL